MKKLLVFLYFIWQNVYISLITALDPFKKRINKGEIEMKNFKLPKGVQKDLAKIQDEAEETLASFNGQEETEDEPNGNTLEQPKLTRFMVGTYLDPKSGEWMIAQAKFDPITKTVGEFVATRAAGDREVMREKFQITVVTLGLFDAEAPKDTTAFNIY